MKTSIFHLAAAPLALLAFAASASAATIYVAPSGNDASRAPSNLRTPLRSIQAAANLARPGDVVQVRGGTYRETVIPARSGEAGKPIVFRPYANERVVLSGTSGPIQNWTRTADGLYSAPAPAEYVSANNQSDQVFVNGQMLNLARWPVETNRDLSRPRTGIVDSVTTSDKTDKKAPGPGYDVFRVTFTDQEFDEPDGRWEGAQFWVNTGGAEQGGEGTQDGNGQTGTVLSTNRERHEITVEVDAGGRVGTETPANFQFGKGSHFTLFNPRSVAGLTREGWWRDRDAKRLYVRLPNGVAPQGSAIEAKQRDWAFDLSEKSHITVQNFDLFACSITTDREAGNGRENGGNRTGSVAPAHHITLDGLRVRYVSHFTDQSGNLQTQWDQSSGIILSGSDNILRNSLIEWSAGCGVVCIGQRNKVLNNIVHDTNYLATDGGGIGLGVRGSTVSLDHEIGYNTVYNTGIDGIEFGALKNSTSNVNDIRARIHHNLVHDTVLQSADSGALHTFSSDGQWTRIDHNIIYNTGGPTPGYLFFGIYLDYAPDDGKVPARYVVDHNVVYNTSSPINLNHAHTDLIFNNTLIARPEVDRGAIHANGGPFTDVVIRNNLGNRDYVRLGPGAKLENNLTTSDLSIFVDPLNPDMSKRNFQLKAGATAALDKGVAVAPFDDPLVGAPDLGAYEFGAPAWKAGATLPETLPATR